MTWTALPDSSSFRYMRRLPAQKIFFQKVQALLVIKRFWTSLIHTLIYFQSLGINYLQDMNTFYQSWDRKPGGKDETLLKRFTRRSLTKVYLSVIVLDVRMWKLLGLLELNSSLVWGTKNRLAKDYYFIKCNQALIKCLENFIVMFVQFFVYLGSEFV